MERYKSTHIASIVGIVANFILLILKGVIGIFTNSQAMIADAFNSFGDVLSSIMTFIGNKISSKEADDDHNLGHGKAEYIYSFIISIIMILTSTTVIKNAITTYIKNIKIDFSFYLIIVCIITIIIKFILYLYTKKISKKYNSILLDANSKDHRNDCLITSMSLISVIFGMKGINYIDIITGIGISVWIGYTAIKIFKDSYDVLMDKCMDNETKDKVYTVIKKYKEVKKINHFNATPVGYRYQVSFTIFVDGNLTTFESHEIANKIEREIEKEIPEIYLTVIHINPIEIQK